MFDDDAIIALAGVRVVRRQGSRLTVGYKDGRDVIIDYGDVAAAEAMRGAIVEALGR